MPAWYEPVLAAGADSSPSPAAADAAQSGTTTDALPRRTRSFPDAKPARSPAQPLPTGRSPIAEAPVHNLDNRPCSAALPSTVAIWQNTVAIPIPPAAPPGPMRQSSAPAAPDNAADRRPVLRGRNFSRAAQGSHCRTRSPLPARSPSPILRGVRTRLALSSRCRDIAPVTGNSPAPCVSRTPHTPPPAAATVQCDRARSVPQWSLPARATAALVASRTAPVDACSTPPNSPPAESAPRSEERRVRKECRSRWLPYH